MFPTRARSTQAPSLLDLDITNDYFIYEVDNFSPLGLSDHSVLHVRCKLTVPSYRNNRKLNLDRGDYGALSSYISHNLVNNTDMYPNGLSVSDMWDKFKATLELVIKRFVPLVKEKTWKNKDTWEYPIDNT